jgi:bacterioferritin
MKGDPQIIEVLNECLTAELTAINQYFLHAKLCSSWGYEALAAYKREESMDEMRHAEQLTDRILYLDGIPNMQRYFPIRIGEDVVEMQRLDLDMELEALDRLNRGIKLCREKGDAGSAELLEQILTSEEPAVDWLETQLSLIEQIGLQNYLAKQVQPGGPPPAPSA